MPHSSPAAEHIDGILAELADALIAVEARQDELDRAALQLVQLVGVDVQDITDSLDAAPTGELFDPAGELAEIATWLAAHRTDHPALVTELTALLDTAAAALSNLTAS